MRKGRSVVAVSIVVLTLFGCDSDNGTQAVIHLPEGDAEQGKAHFVSLGCASCHTVIGAELPEGEEGPIRVVLGGSGRITSYGDLVTSVVNPSHKLSRRFQADDDLQDDESPMPIYNDVMTISQLTDLVAFLQQHYQRTTRPRYQYRRYDADIQPSAERKRAVMDKKKDEETKNDED